MKRWFNYILDWSMLIFLSVTAFCGIPLFLYDPYRRMLGREYILGIKGKTLMTVHQWAGIIFFILMVIHIIIHLKWLTNPPKIKAGKSE
jgi:hypothetical protein